LNAGHARHTHRKGAGKKSPVPVARALEEFAVAIGIDSALRRYGVITAWDETVGEQIARVARPQRIENGVLYVSVASAPWRAELTMKRPEIIRKLNEAAGEAVVKDIRFR
jgi:predicted nucleic acid-binding Zn ribbon protein